ncbi:MAG TPA: penicillin-binding transpeptidase domain-containing protein [Actinomycetales bacterium]|nr:penicillin-binding transpeptidase domain-containing protein [Actinomycetales bacterium]
MNAPLRRLAVVAFLLFATLLVSATWTSFVAAPNLNADGRNTRTIIEQAGRERGPIVIGDQAVAKSVPVDDVYGFLRQYEPGALYAHVTGYYSVIYGPTGMEQAEADLLTGTSDRLFYRRISDLVTGREPKGATLELTIDPKVQKAASDALGNQRGAVVALNPKTGDVLAMVSKPSFDPNSLASHSSKEAAAARQKLLDDPARPLDNRAIAGRLYPPGSVFKLVTTAAALESGKYEPNSVLPGPANLDLPQTTVGLPNSGGRACGPNDQVSLADALRISCNTAFGYLGMDLGGDALHEQARKFGFGEDLRIPLRVSPSSVPADMNEPQEAQAGIGQFDVRVTPMQMAMVSAAIANDGVLMKPNLLKAARADDLSVISQPQPTELGRAVSPETAQKLTDMMLSVVNDGTGKAAQINGVQVAGKTGTAQHAKGQAPHAWFTAFAPADNPEVAVAVVVEQGGSAGDQASGGRTAAPIARKVIQAVMDR